VSGRLVCVAAAACLAATGCGDDGADKPPAPTVKRAPRFDAPPFHARPVKVRVVPPKGGIHTPFRILIRRPQFVGVRGHARFGYTARATQKPLQAGCITDTDGFVDERAWHRVAHVVLDPSEQKGQIWCRGDFPGRLLYTQGYACPSRGTCHRPRGFPRHTRVVARFSFRVVSGGG
jgi:hypothetical protein